MRRASKSAGETLLHPYAGTHPAEFLAESTEVFFERPRDSRREHRSLYRESLYPESLYRKSLYRKFLYHELASFQRRDLAADG